jgi:uncharacterized protein YjbI with pentapeptide repeats
MLIITIIIAAVTAVTTTVGLIAAPIVGVTLNDSVSSITPAKLASLLENGNISEFNNERNQIKQEIVFESIDLSNKDLNGVNLESLILLHSNLSN